MIIHIITVVYKIPQHKMTKVKIRFSLCPQEDPNLDGISSFLLKEPHTGWI